MYKVNRKEKKPATIKNNDKKSQQTNIETASGQEIDDYLHYFSTGELGSTVE